MKDRPHKSVRQLSVRDTAHAPTTMSEDGAFALRPSARSESSYAVSMGEAIRLLAQPHVALCALYAVAICFEQLVEIDVFKPYRLIGAALVVLMLMSGRYLVDRFARLAMAFIGLGFVIGLAQSAVGPGNFPILLSTMARWCFNLATYIAIASLLRTRQELILVAVIHAVVLLVAAYGISLEATKDAMFGELLITRASGDFGNPANACVAMLFAGVVLITIIRQRVAAFASSVHLMHVVAIVAICLYLLYTASLTGSRAGAGLLLLGLAVYFLFTLRQRIAVITAVLLGALAVLLVFGMSDLNLSETNVLAARIEKKGWDTSRLYLWLSGLEAFADTFGIGVGMARYRELHREYFAPHAYNSDPRWLDKDLTLHNDYVIALVEYGVIGFCVFAMLCFQLWKMVQQLDDQNLRAIGMAVLAGMAVNGLTHAGFPYFIVWFYFALLSAWVSMQNQRIPTRRTASDRGIRSTSARGADLRNRLKSLR